MVGVRTFLGGQNKEDLSLFKAGAEALPANRGAATNTRHSEANPSTSLDDSQKGKALICKKSSGKTN